VVEFATQLVAKRHASLRELLASTGERPQRLGLVGVGLKCAEAVMIGARQLAEHERVKRLRLTRGADAGVQLGDVNGESRNSSTRPAMVASSMIELGLR
jgi:hypothetical protein